MSKLDSKSSNLRIIFIDMSDDSVLAAKGSILNILADLSETEFESIEKWINSQSFRKDLKMKKKLAKKDKKLLKIANSIKMEVPFEAEMITENITPPTVGDQADCTKINTLHVDEFLYDQQQVEELIQMGKLKRTYCVDCNSRNTKDLVYVSHSMSRQALQYIFTVLLPKDLEEKQILDVGSRLGAVLFAAYYYSNASSIIGIEMNKECCDIQNKMIAQYGMDNNIIKVINADVMDQCDVVAVSDIVIINVLDFFVDVEKHKEMWYFFKKHIKKGSYLISNRSMADTLNGLDIFEEFIEWLNICKPCQLENEIFFDIEDGVELYIYTTN